MREAKTSLRTRHVKQPRDILKYDLGCYDKHYCLKPPLALLAATVFACREFLLPLVLLIGSLKGGAQYEIDFLFAEHRGATLLAQIPALLVVYAMIRRMPSGDAAARWIWKRGRMILGVSLLADAYLAAAFSDLSVAHLHAEAMGPLARMTLDVGILLYLALSGRVKDSFASFPAAPA